MAPRVASDSGFRSPLLTSRAPELVPEPSTPRGIAGFDLVARLLFPAPPSTYAATSFPPGELLWAPRRPGVLGSMTGSDPGPGTRMPCLFLPYSSARFVVYYIHTNAEDLGRCRPFCANLRAQFQVHVFAIEYPGYGIAEGGPCDERAATECALAGLRFLREALRWPLDSILIMGRSIGCGPAIALATAYEVAGLILVSPMLSFRELVKDIAGPLAPLLEERFPNGERLKLTRSPLLLVHGLKDIVIPPRHSVELFRMCRSRKMLVSPPDMGHNTDLFGNVNYLVLPMLQFFALPDYCFEEVEVPTWAYAPDCGKPAPPPCGAMPTSEPEDEHTVEEDYSRDALPPSPATCFTAPSATNTPRAFFADGAPGVGDLVRRLFPVCAGPAAAALPCAAGLLGAGPEGPRGKPGAMPSAPSAGVFVRAPPVPDAGWKLAEVEVEGAVEPPPVAPHGSAQEQLRKAPIHRTGPSIRLPVAPERTASRSMLQAVRGQLARDLEDNAGSLEMGQCEGSSQSGL